VTPPMSPTSLQDVDALDDSSFQQVALEARWSDGLPVLAPTAERVEAMLAMVDAAPDFSLGRVAPTGRTATVEAVAANAVMAGCQPQWFPVVLAAVSAVLDPAFNLEGIQPTTHPVSSLILVNGPLAGELGYNCEGNALGPGTAANATTGRALRLVLQNIGGGRSPDLDRSTQGGPAKFTYCAAENEAASPWGPLHVDRGYDRDESTVTVFGGEAPHNIEDHVSSTAEGILYTAASTIAGRGANNPYVMGEVVVLLGPEHARTIADQGWSKTHVRDFLYDTARSTKRELKRGGMWGMTYWPPWFDAVDDDHPLPVVENQEGMIVAVVGGPGKHSSCIHSWGATRGVTRPVLHSGLDRLVLAGRRR
jgi:hypothetical protein